MKGHQTHGKAVLTASQVEMGSGGCHQDASGAQSAPKCGLCGRPRRWVAKREQFALYCAGQNCSATERACKSCGTQFEVGSPGSKPRECSNCATTTRAAIDGHPGSSAPPWSGRRVQAARQVVAETLPQPCGRCGDVVDGTDPWVVGHTLSRVTHPEMTWDPDNWRPEHRVCSDRSAGFAAREVAYRDGFSDGWISAVRHLKEMSA